MGGVNLVMRDVVSNSVFKTRRYFVLPQQLFPAPAPGRGCAAGLTLQTSPWPFVGNAAESLLFDLYVKLGKELHNRCGFGGCICPGMGYPIPAHLIENHRVFTRSHLGVRSEAGSAPRPGVCR